MLIAALAVVPVAVAPAVAAAPEGDGRPSFWPDEYDYPLVPSAPLPEGHVVADPAEEAPPALLGDDAGDLPQEAEATVELEGSWTDVPGTPVEVQTSDTLPPSTDPAQPGLASPSADSATEAPEGSDVEVTVLESQDLQTAVTLLQVETTAVDASDPTESPDPSDGPSPSQSPTGTPTSSPSESATGSTEAPDADPTSSTPTPSPEGSASPTPSETSAPGDEPAVGEEVPAEGVAVRFSYADFDELYGAGWADRLVIRAYPECFVTTPEAAGCSTGVVVESVNNQAQDRLEFVTPPAAEVIAPALEQVANSAPSASRSSTGGESESAARTGARVDGLAEDGVVFAVASEPKQFAATPYRVSSEWQVGTGSGEFSYSYPFDLPAATGGATPSLGLTYSSGSVDTLATGQSSETGIGWADLSVGYITREFADCDDDEGIGSSPFDDRGDKCWRTFPDDDGTPNVNEEQLVEELFLVLDGRSSRLVLVSEDEETRTDEFRLVDDPGWKVTRRYDDDTLLDGQTPLVDNDHERWIVRTPEGTEYRFGALSDTGGGSNATWTVPVFGNNAGEKCHAGTSPAALANSWCTQAWRWNLDRVVDPVGNEVRYTYTAASNFYDRFNGAGMDGAPAEYHRAGSLAKVEYGFRTHPDNPNDVAGPARQTVEITTVPRCWSAIAAQNDGLPGTDPTAVACNAANPSGPGNNWPDTPTDMVCGNVQTCADAPAFFSTRRLYQVVTKVRQGTGGTNEKKVSTYTLQHVMPDPTDPDDMQQGEPPAGLTIYADLWLNFVKKTGHIADEPGETPASVNDSLHRVAFDGRIRNNRVALDLDNLSIGLLPKWRLFAIRNELGGRIDVDYGHEPGNDCTKDYIDGTDNELGNSDDRERWTSTKECFALPDPESPLGPAAKFDWYHKYVVRRVAISDDALHYRYDSPLDSHGPANPLPVPGPNPGQVQVTEYEYDGPPAWRYTQSQNQPTARESWSDWRGYEQTKTHALVVKDQVPVKDRTNPSGPVDESVTRVTRYRGMDQSKADPSNNNISASITTVEGTFPDHRWFNGMVAETALLKPGTEGLVERTNTVFDWINTTSEVGTRPYNSRLVYTKTQVTTTQLTDTTGANSALRKHQIDYTVNTGGTSNREVTAGAVTQVEDRGDLAVTGDEKCALTTYQAQDSATTWMRRPGVTQLHAGLCSATPLGAQQSRTEYFYDDQEDTPANLLSKGLVTGIATDTAADAATNPAHRLLTETDYDSYGRPTQVTDPRGNITTTEYNAEPSGNSPGDVLTHLRGTQQQAPGPDLVTRTKLDAQSGLPTEIIDPNDKSTRVTYDGLGRTKKVFLPNNTNPLSGVASTEFLYYTSLRDSINDSTDLDQPSRIITNTLRSSGIRDTSNVFYDGWGRLIQSDSMRPQDPYTLSQRVVTSTSYDHRGLAFVQTGPFPAGNPDSANPKIVNPILEGAGVTVSRYAVTTYDAASRPTAVAEKSAATTYRTTETDYLGNATVVDPPDTGTTTTTFDVWNRPTQVTHGPDTGVPGPTDTASYTYTPRGELDTITKTLPSTGPAVWNYDYDWAGRRAQAVDPDIGVTVTAYDKANNPIRTETYKNLVGGTPATLIERIDTTYDQLNRPTHRYDAKTVNPVLFPGDDNYNEANRELTAWTYDVRTPAQVKALVPGEDNFLGRLSSATATNRSHPLGSPGLISPTLLPWKITQLIRGYDANGNPTGEATQYPTDPLYPTWLTHETANVDTTTPADGLDAVEHGTTTTYNQLDQPTSITYDAVPGIGQQTVNYTYLTDGLLNSMSVTGMNIATATYTPIGELSTLTTANAPTATSSLERTYTYEPATGRPSIMAATQRTNGSSPIQRLGLLYEYDKANNPTRITNVVQATTGGTNLFASWCYTYDPIQRLAHAWNGTTSGATCLKPSATATAPSAEQNHVKAITGELHDLTYTYTGDRLNTVAGTADPPGSTTYSTATHTYNYGNGTPHQTSGVTGSGSAPGVPPQAGTISYDFAGRATDVGILGATRSYYYDPLGQHTRTTTYSTHNHNFAYDANGMRFARTTPPLPEFAVAGTTIWVGDTEITKYTSGGRTTSTRTFTTPDGTPVATLTGKDPAAGFSVEVGWQWLMSDAQNTIRLTRAPAGVYRQNHYYPYGEPSAITTPQTTDQLRGYLNKTHDRTGDLRLDHRTYTPNLNQLLTPDPLLQSGEPQSLNPYVYASNNPIANSDGSGLDPNIGNSPDSGSGPVGPDRPEHPWGNSLFPPDGWLSDPDLPCYYNCPPIDQDLPGWERVDWGRTAKTVSIVAAVVAAAGGCTFISAGLATAGCVAGANSVGGGLLAANQPGDQSVSEIATAGAVSALMGTVFAKFRIPIPKLRGPAANGASGAESALSGALLRNHLRQLEKYGQGGFRELESGRFRYYGGLSPASKSGDMVGRRVVREWDPASGATRTWHETIDRSGNVRIVRPQTGGPKTHYYFDEFGNYGGSW